ncbi:MAG: choice-of-anchor D domain-containing protein [Bacteroidetes bacterium]|nr:choice-of-anchor D domain-containing protein [Bacteroidota bacterium]
MRTLFFIVLVVFQLSYAEEIQAQFNTSSSRFIENQGQIIGIDNQPIPDVKFYTGTKGGVQAYFTSAQVSYVFPKTEKKPTPQIPNTQANITELYRMDVEYIGANPNARITGTEQTAEYTNYYLAHCPQGITHVPTFGKLVVHDLYPNIDVVWQTTERGLKNEFIVRPGGDYHQIAMRYKGARVEQNSTLITAITPFGSLQDESPISFQNGSEVETHFQQTEGTYGFSVGEYDKTQTLIIDPMVVWGVYQNEVLSDFGILGMKVDGGGNVIIAGSAPTSTFPTTPGVIQQTYGGGNDCYLAKFDKDGNRIWGTYYGGSGGEPVVFGDLFTNCLTLDANNNIVYVGATASTDFPRQNATQNVYGGGTVDMFIIKLFSNGTREWATYYGGSNDDIATGATVDPLGKVIIVGYSVSINFPTFGAVFQPANPLGGGTGVVIKLNPDGARQWATFCGDIANAANSDYLAAVTTDNSGNIYTTGSTTGTFPTTSSTFQPTNNSFGSKITVTKLDANGQRVWATFHGRGIGNDIICDNSNLYVVGTSGHQGTFEVTSGFSNAIKGAADVCIFTLDNGTGNRNATSWSRLLGGTGQAGSWQYGYIDYGMNIGFDSGGGLWIGGLAAECTDFPVTTNTSVPSWAYTIQQTYKGGSTDGFFAQFEKATGNIQYCSLFGSIGQDYGGYALPFGSSGLYFGINSFHQGNAATFPVPTDRRIGTPYSITIAKICTTTGVNTNAGPDSVLCSGDTIQIGSAPIGGVSYSWNTRANLSDSTIANPKVFPKNTGTTQTTLTYNVLATDATGCYGRDTVVLTVKPGPTVTASTIPPPQCIGTIGSYSLTGVYTSPKSDDKFRWEARGGVIIGDNTLQTISVVWTNVGLDTVYLTVTNGFGCSARARLLVEVSPLPIVDAGPDIEICEDSVAVLLSSASGGIGNLTYSWTPSATFITSPTLLRPSVKPSQPITQYFLTATDSRGCISKDSMRVIMNPKPIAFAGKDLVVCRGESVLLSADSSAGGTPPYTIQWTPTAGLSSTTITNPILTPTVSNNYIFHVTDAKGCKAQDTVFVQVITTPSLVFSSSSIDFGQLNSCTSSLEKTVSIFNNSSLVAKLTKAIPSNPSFSVTTGFPIIIGANGKTDIKIKYAPVSTGISSGTITFEGSPCGIVLPIQVSGEKLNLAVKSFPATVDFGQSISCTNKVTDTTITIHNTGLTVLSLSAPTIQSPYSIVSPGFPQSVNVGDSIKIRIRYAPTVDGNYNQTIGIPYLAGSCNDTVTISMNGESISQNLVISPPMTIFPTLIGCDVFRDTVITIENPSAMECRIDSTIRNGLFKILSPVLPTFIKSGDKLQFKVRFEPKNSGTINDSLQFAFSPCNKIISAKFSGEKQGVSFALSDTLDAGEIIKCVNGSATVTLQIENTSSNATDGSVLSVKSGNSLSTTLMSGTALPNKTPLNFNVTVTPQNDGLFVDSLIITFNPCGITKTVFVKGRRTDVGFKADVASVNIGKIQNGTNRSAPVVFTNTGSTKLTITSVPNLAPPFSITNILPPLPAELLPNEKLTVTVTYLAIDGIQTSTVLAFGTIPCAVVDSVIIQGEGTDTPQPSISITKRLNFDSVCVGVEKILTAKLTNDGGVPLQILQAVLSGNTGDYSLKNFAPRTLLPSEDMSVDVGCMPLAVGVTAARIVWITDLIRDSTELIGIGKDCSTPDSTFITIADAEAETGDNIKIALILKKEVGLVKSGAKKFSATVRFNRTIIHATDPTLSCLSGTSPDICEMDISGEYKFGQDTIAFFSAEATLGAVESTKLELVAFKWLNGNKPVEVIRQDGEFRLTNLCFEGGVRLYNPTKSVSLNVVPNPTNGSAEIEYTLREESPIKVTMMDMLGREVMVIDEAIRKPGTYKRNVEFTNTGVGIYFLMLQCPNVTKTIRMSIVK